MISPRSEPIAQQISRKLRQQILDGIYQPGSRLPSEPEMSRQLGVSRATLRTALTELAAENLIHRRQGDGTFVSDYAEDVNTTLGGMLLVFGATRKGLEVIVLRQGDVSQ